MRPHTASRMGRSAGCPETQSLYRNGKLATAAAVDETRNRMAQFVGRAWDQVKSPLYRNAFFIMLSSIIGNALGLLFWIVAFRFYDLTDAGFALTMVNTVAFLAGVASLGLPIALIRFLPESDGQKSLVNTALTIAGALSAAIALVFILGISWWAPGLVVVFGRIEYIPIVVVTAMAYAFGPILDESAIAMRRADLSMWRTTLFALVKIPLPVVFSIWLGTTLGGTLGVYASWSIAYGVSVLIAAFLFLPRAIPGYRPTPRLSRRRLRPMFAFSTGNWAASLVGSAGALLLPLLIINTLQTMPSGVAVAPAAAVAIYYAATVIAGTLSVIPAATMTSLYAEASQRNAQRARDERRAILLAVTLLVPGIIAMWMFAAPLLSLLFALDRNADLGVTPLRLLSLASIPAFLNSVLSTRVRVRKQVIPLIVSSSIATVVTLALGYLMLLAYGLPGLAASVVLGLASATPYLYLVAGKPMEAEPIEPAPTVP